MVFILKLADLVPIPNVLLTCVLYWLLAINSTSTISPFTTSHVVHAGSPLINSVPADTCASACCPAGNPDTVTVFDLYARFGVALLIVLSVKLSGVMLVGSVVVCVSFVMVTDLISEVLLFSNLSYDCTLR